MQHDEKHILLVDDDTKLTALIQPYLESNGYQVRCLHDGQSAMDHIRENQPRLVVLDVMLPGLDGLTVCRKIRKFYKGPIIMLTAMDEDIDEVAGLELGADDYLSKPVRPRVLLARIRAVLRRVERSTGELTKIEVDNTTSIQIGRLSINRATMEAHMGQSLLELTSSEFELLWLLASNKGEIVCREDLHAAVLHTPYDGLDRTIDIRISRLRKKIMDDSKSPHLIKTIRGKGYLYADSSQ